MMQESLTLKNSMATGYVIPAGPVNLVMVIAKSGMVGCGAFDVAALDAFGYPAAKVRPSRGNAVGTIGDLCAGIVKEMNTAAKKLGVEPGMTGREALDLFS
jgi:uncharacterized protein YunC (DUF1805 family)